MRETNGQIVFLWCHARRAGASPSVLEAGQESGTERLVSWLAGTLARSPRAWKTTAAFSVRR